MSIYTTNISMKKSTLKHPKPMGGYSTNKAICPFMKNSDPIPFWQESLVKWVSFRKVHLYSFTLEIPPSGTQTHVSCELTMLTQNHYRLFVNPSGTNILNIDHCLVDMRKRILFQYNANQVSIDFLAIISIKCYHVEPMVHS